MKSVLFKCIPYCKDSVLMALECGIDGIIVPDEYVNDVSHLSRVPVLCESSFCFSSITSKHDEEALQDRLLHGETVCIKRGWDVIPIENILAQCQNVIAEVGTLDEALLASGILERGVDTLVVTADAIQYLKDIVMQCKVKQKSEKLVSAVITRIEPAGLGHRVCVDTTALMKKGNGMLAGSSSAFMFLVHSETEYNEYVASRPFRVNAGAVHTYIKIPDGKTAYLGELQSGSRILVADTEGNTSVATVGRAKIEVRPMLMIEACFDDICGTIFLQNAETVCLVSSHGEPVSVVSLKVGDSVLCTIEKSGRHFGMHVQEDIKEI